MALGASHGRIVRQLLGQSLVLVAIGSAIGLGGVVALGQALGAVLYVPAWDPVSILGGVGVLALVAIAASALAARRAAAVDPLITLRQS